MFRCSLPLTLANPLAVWITNSTMATLARCVPPELFEHILWHVQRGSLTSCERKRVLSACCLVCRYWANQTRRLIFLQLALSSAKDIRTLTTFVTSSTPEWSHWPISRCVHVLIIEKKNTSHDPWTHHIYPLMKLLCKGNPNPTQSLPIVLRFHMDFTSATSLTPPRICSVHWELPRSLPRRLTSMIEDLTLRNIELRHLDDLLVPIKELPHLGSLTCENVSWQASSNIQRSTKLPVRYPDMLVKARGCTNDAELCLRIYHHSRRYCSRLLRGGGSCIPFYVTINSSLQSESLVVRDIIQLLHGPAAATHPDAELEDGALG